MFRKAFVSLVALCALMICTPAPASADWTADDIEIVSEEDSGGNSALTFPLSNKALLSLVGLENTGAFHEATVSRRYVKTGTSDPITITTICIASATATVLEDPFAAPSYCSADVSSPTTGASIFASAYVPWWIDPPPADPEYARVSGALVDDDPTAEFQDTDTVYADFYLEGVSGEDGTHGCFGSVSFFGA